MKRRLLLVLAIASVIIVAIGCAPAAAPAPAPTPAPPRQEDKALYGQPATASEQAGRSAASPAGQPAAPASGTAPGGQTVFTDRMIINNAQLSLEVKDATDSLDAVGEIAERQGGFVSGSNFRYEGERKVATVIIRVPSTAYEATMAELRRLGIKVLSQDSKSQDVTEEYADLRAQLTNLQATEAQYLELLKRAQNIDEILKVQARLNETRREIERIKGRTVYLERTTEMASITVSLFSRDGAAASTQDKPGVWWRTPAEAFEQSLVFLARVATALATGIAFFWWLILIIAAGYFAMRIASARRAASGSATKP